MGLKPHHSRMASFAGMVIGMMLSACQPVQANDPLAPYLERPATDDVIYFLLPDRFEDGEQANNEGYIEGGALAHGYNPAHKGFYHGGDLKGLTQRLDYIKGLGASAIWLGPIYKNKPVQGPKGAETAGYHGYWITDFTDVDPHFGTREDLKTFIDAAHANNIKVYLDIIVNHTADVISYKECHSDKADPALKEPGACPYRSKTDYPYTANGLNTGFNGGQAHNQTKANFTHLSSPNYAYQVELSQEDANLKKPEWLNDVTLYHNRGDSHWHGESAVYGDFAGLDDLFTENPQVRDGFIEIYKQWITDFRVDGFRIDTAKHVNPEFWPVFNEAMIDHAATLGIPNFYIFGEVYSGDPIELSRFTTLHGFPAVLDFGFREKLEQSLAQNKPSEVFANLFRADSLYDPNGTHTSFANKLPVFISSHDTGRFAHYIKAANPDISDKHHLARTRLAHALMIFARGIPVIYAGDEQGFVGDGGDQDAREDMFPSQVASYNDNNLIGTDQTTAISNFNPDHPLYTAIKQMAEIFHSEPALRQGEQVMRLSEKDGGLIAISRLKPEQDGEILLIANMSDKARTARIEVDSRSQNWTALMGSCKAQSSAPALYDVNIPAWDLMLCKSNSWTQK